jgi:hypothetical protein
MFDELTFALRYGPEVHLHYFVTRYVLPAPVTQKGVEFLKSCRVWQHFEAIVGPYVVNQD